MFFNTAINSIIKNTSVRRTLRAGPRCSLVIFLYSVRWIPLKAGHLVPDQGFRLVLPSHQQNIVKPGAKKKLNQV